MIFQYKYTYDKGKIEVTVTETESGNVYNTTSVITSDQMKEIGMAVENIKPYIVNLIVSLQKQAISELTLVDGKAGGADDIVFDENEPPFDDITSDEVDNVINPPIEEPPVDIPI